MQVIGVGTAQADQPVGTGCGGSLDVRPELEPFVAGQLRVEQIEAQYGQLDGGAYRPVE